jgi:hypothetical protein
MNDLAENNRAEAAEIKKRMDQIQSFAKAHYDPEGEWPRFGETMKEIAEKLYADVSNFVEDRLGSAKREVDERLLGGAVRPRHMGKPDRVVLTRDVPKHDLRLGDVGTIVGVKKGNTVYKVRLDFLNGKTITTIGIPADHVRPLGQREIAHARLLAG